MDEDRFTMRAGEVEWSQCVYCRHLSPGGLCPAFPAGIPDEITYNLHDHRLSYPGDGGLLMEPKAGLEGYEFRSWERFKAGLLGTREIAEPDAAAEGGA